MNRDNIVVTKSQQFAIRIVRFANSYAKRAQILFLSAKYSKAERV